MRSKWYMIKYLYFLLKLWIKHPYLRFAQLLANACDFDIYYLEDERFKQLLNERYRRK